MAWRAAIGSVAAAVLAGCATTPKVEVVRPPPGLAQRPYTALPWYLMPPPPPPLPAPNRVGRYDACVPVAGTAWYPSAERLERLRLALARVDTVLVGLRQPALLTTTTQVAQTTPPANQTATPSTPQTSTPPTAKPMTPPTNVTQPESERQLMAGHCEPEVLPTPEELQRLALEVRALVSVRPDLRAEADELAWLAGQLPSADSLRREQILNRAGELTNLIRIQLAAS